MTKKRGGVIVLILTAVLIIGAFAFVAYRAPKTAEEATEFTEKTGWHPILYWSHLSLQSGLQNREKIIMKRRSLVRYLISSLWMNIEIRKNWPAVTINMSGMPSLMQNKVWIRSRK